MHMDADQPFYPGMKYFWSMVVLLLIVALTLVQHFSHKSAPTQPQMADILDPNGASSAPLFDPSTSAPSGGPDVDPATINPVNNGFTVDLGEAEGLFKLDGNTLWWTPSPVANSKPVVVLQIKGSLIAYTFQLRPGDTRPSIIFWTSNRKGYYQTCRGVSGGIPQFGPPVELEAP